MNGEHEVHDVTLDWQGSGYIGLRYTCYCPEEDEIQTCYLSLSLDDYNNDWWRTIQGDLDCASKRDIMRSYFVFRNAGGRALEAADRQMSQ